MKRITSYVAVSLICALASSFFGERSCYAGYVTFGNGFGSKWGTPQHGTASDVITWSFMNDGVALHSTHPLVSEVTGTSSITTLRNSFSAGVFDQAIQNAFNTWAAAVPGRITFQQVADNGAVGGLNNSTSADIDIRIGAFTAVANSGFSFAGAVGYGPPGDDTNMFFRDALAGDITFNLSQSFFVAPGQEGDIFYTGGTYVNDLEGLMLHELGHAAIGLGHPSGSVGEVMFVDSFPNCCNFVNRQLSPDDIAGAFSVYAVPEPSSSATAIIVCGFFAARYRKRIRERLFRSR